MGIGMEGMKNGENWMIDLEEMIWMNDSENGLILWFIS